MPISVLTPTEVAERCYLSEALLWIAVNRFPLAYHTENNCDVREDSEAIDGLNPNQDGEPMTPDECRRAGLPNNPAYEALMSGDYLGTTEGLRSILKIEDLDSEERARFERDLEKANVYEAQLDAWSQDYDAFIDLPKGKLFLALREGRVTALGKRLPKPKRSAALEFLESNAWDKWDDVIWEPIKPDFWRSDGIDWDDCHAEGRDAAYCLILVNTSELLEQFPPTAEATTEIIKVGDAYLFPEQRNGGLAAQSQKRGRPAFNWDQFHVEVARCIREGGLPDKQEALIAQMQEWCRKRWGREVGRSTILQKLKLYYDVLS